MTHVRPGVMGMGRSTSFLAERDRGRGVSTAIWEYLRLRKISSNLEGLDRSSRRDRFLVNTRKALRIKMSRSEEQTHFPRVNLQICSFVTPFYFHYVLININVCDHNSPYAQAVIMSPAEHDISH